MVQRFMLNLRQVNQAEDIDNSDPAHLSRFSVRFRVPSGFVGNIGESLDYEDQANEVDEGDVAADKAVYTDDANGVGFVVTEILSPSEVSPSTTDTGIWASHPRPTVLCTVGGDTGSQDCRGFTMASSQPQSV